MKLARRRAIGALVALTAAAATSVLAAGPAQADAAAEASLTFSGDPGDWITGGGSYAYDTDDGDVFDANTDPTHTVLTVAVTTTDGTFWILSLTAPAGQSLVPGTYDGATRFGGETPALDLYGNGRGCNTVTGSFVVQNAVFGTGNYVQQFDATFEQHCDGVPDAARGELHILNPPPPAALAIDVSVAANGTVSTVSGRATVHGRVTCTKAASVNVSGLVTQIVKRVIVNGSFSTQVACTPDAPVRWTATVPPSGTTPFKKGDVQVDVTATALDQDYGNFPTATAGRVVALTTS